MLKGILHSILIVFFLLLANTTSFSQSIYFKVIDKDSHEPLQGAIIQNSTATIGTESDLNGLAQININPLPKSLELQAHIIGYDKLDFSILADTAKHLILLSLSKTKNELGTVEINTLRTNTRIEDAPTKVEVIGLEEIGEETTLQPSNLTSLLGDLSYIHVQHQAGASGNNMVRMLGLNSNYTQVLRDGLPSLDGVSSNLGLLSAQPLDLQQVDVIKGSASTLYGGGAIAGIINLISPTPSDSPTTSLLLNATSLSEKNVHLFTSWKKNKVGYTLFVASNNAVAKDLNNDNLSDVPENHQLIIHPRFFIDINKKCALRIGVQMQQDNRKGGNMSTIQGIGNDNYSNNYQLFLTTSKSALDYQFTSKWRKNQLFTFKGIATHTQQLQDEGARGKIEFQQNSLFSEMSNLSIFKKGSLIEGYSVRTYDAYQGLFETYTTHSLFFQETQNWTNWLATEAGYRVDLVNGEGLIGLTQNKIHHLPRLSIYIHPSEKWSFRIGGGNGYRNPSIYTPELLENPLNGYSTLFTYNAKNQFGRLTEENSQGIQSDFNYHYRKGIFGLQFNQAFYYTQISNPLTVKYNYALVDGIYPSQQTIISNNPNSIYSQGSDTYLRLNLNELEWYLGYNYTEVAYMNTPQYTPMTLFPHHKFASTVLWELEGEWKIGLEAAWQGLQYINNTTYKKAPDYWFLAAMVSKKWKRSTLTLNVENIMNYRQSRVQSMYIGNLNNGSNNPNLLPVWGPLEGRVINISYRINFN
ncbi:MAG: TonB-dependent receptor plug domain-containing protein [Chitinophagales bacterium]|nr:TonB-dependent receptor plug domain-containing protein [Chitinophagales bacterium]